MWTHAPTPLRSSLARVGETFQYNDPAHGGVLWRVMLLPWTRTPSLHAFQRAGYPVHPNYVLSLVYHPAHNSLLVGG